MAVAFDSLDYLVPEDRGHDPYNYVGRRVRRHEAWQGTRNMLKDKVLIMDRSVLDIFRNQQDVMRELAPKPRFLAHGLMGAQIITPNFTFPTTDA